MIRRMFVPVLALGFLWLALAAANSSYAQQPHAFGRVWGGAYQTHDWDRFYHYPYVFYPHNYWGSEYFRSDQSLYYRYPPEMRIPVYNKQWHNMYPGGHRYHSGHHFILDVF
jgi:hypothetical protein